MNIIVSKCLLGENCRYDGKSCKNENVIKLGEKYTLIAVCPEELGGLTCPREPSEILNNRVIAKDGCDVTEFFNKGAKKCLEIAKDKECKFAVLKAKSPSCGLGKIYDGTFTGKLKTGNGVTADLLFKNGIHIMNEDELRL